ncbi:type II toxin-antitoxin system VapC family toxin [Ramlibacter sp.]|uniref:type II toxin-antitoxin system VapC family toxin n=1 Tax=Ramlibacter sp. TaxID=1917967 RepID=UPI003D10EA70
MPRAILLDANVLIGAFDGDEDNPAHMAAKDQVEALLREPDVRLVLTPLIRYEVLRGCRTRAPEDLNALLNDFDELDVSGLDAVRAAEIFRIAKKAGKSFDKHQFDVFHVVCAERHQLEPLSADGDFTKIMALAAQ